MDLKSCKSTLLIYLGYSFFLSSILGALCILIEYAPSAKHSIEKFGIGTTFLNSVLWSLLLSVTATTSLLNIYKELYIEFALFYPVASDCFNNSNKFYQGSRRYFRVHRNINSFFDSSTVLLFSIPLLHQKNQRDGNRIIVTWQIFCKPMQQWK